MAHPTRNLILILGDQLDEHSAALDDIDHQHDRVVMIESLAESRHVPSHKARTVLFLSAMRHFARRLQSRGCGVDYHTLDDTAGADLAKVLSLQLAHHRPRALVCVEPGEYRIELMLRQVCAAAGIALNLRDDRHFLCSRVEFADWAGKRTPLKMEHFYRRMRRQHGVLMEGNEPVGGAWNFDADNRGSFGKKGPGLVPPPRAFPPDEITREVMETVERLLPDNPGSLNHFDWPLTQEEARDALDDFIALRLPLFGRYQDAMWSQAPYLYHARISAALNLKLLHPRQAIDAALAAWQAGRAPIESVEGFIRQILGWREFIRGVYWRDMPGLAEANHFQHQHDLPAWYWTADTHMNCMRETIGQTLQYGYAHHIQRLMVTGQFGLLAGIAPQQVSHWYLGMYIDAVEWVERPNTAGMALFANGGRFTTKPYVASGKYIERMSNYCQGCRYRPDVRHGENACPMNTLYWHFLDTHEEALAKNPRAGTQLLSLKRLTDEERSAIRAHAGRLLQALDTL